MKSFAIGGIHPREYKLSADSPIVSAALPRRVAVMLGQHIGAPARVMVARGDVVRVGTPVGRADGFVSAAVHSPVSGRVAGIDRVTDAGGYAQSAVLIDVEGDEWETTIDRRPDLVRECRLSPEEIMTKIADAGIVGLGGACFPTRVKLIPPPSTRVECLIVNGAECEPYLTADHRLMVEHAGEIAAGIHILMRALSVNKAFVGIEKNKPDAIARMNDAVSGYAGISVVPLKVKYPQGGEKQLIEAVTGRRIGRGALPVSVGAVVQNVATVFAVYEGVQKNKPLIERVVTVTGRSLAKPSNLRVRIGTPVGQLIEACGGLPAGAGKIISGGPMMGKALVSVDVPVVKGCSGVLVMDEPESTRGVRRDCIRCGHCVDICPMGLEPYLLAALAERGDFERMEHECIMDCIECGSCQFACPSRLPLLDYCRLGKNKVGAMIRSRQAKK